MTFALPIGERWERIGDHGLESADWEVFPMTPWNRGLARDSTIGILERPVPAIPFGRADPAIELTVTGRTVPAWERVPGTIYAAPPPRGVGTEGAGPVEMLTLVPYATAKLRIAAFPEVPRVGTTPVVE